ncbi:MAG: F0F1 ATP synthase subunit delta [Halobacteriovoraceae bacterium]|nr:F0F1 ATP synthase subunit delta [Halobacteriovoraceae bacterium]
MKEAITAKIYARSLFELGEESNIDITKEVTNFSEVINSSNELENVLFLDVFGVEEKQAVFNDLAGKLNLSSLTANTIRYLIQEKRLGLLPMIYKEMVVIDDDKKGFLKSTIEGHGDQIDQGTKDKIKNFLKTKTGKEPVLEYKKNEKITAGYKITAGDLQLDATVDTQLEQLKKDIL